MRGQCRADDVDALIDRQQWRLLGLARTATITVSKTDAARSTMSRWPFVIGSNEPG
jgi:hypothetical protein